MEKCKNCLHLFTEDNFYKCGFGHPVYQPELGRSVYKFTRLSWSCLNFKTQPEGWKLINQKT